MLSDKNENVTGWGYPWRLAVLLSAMIAIVACGRQKPADETSLDPTDNVAMDGGQLADGPADAATADKDSTADATLGEDSQPKDSCTEEENCSDIPACIPEGELKGVFPGAPSCCGDLQEISVAFLIGGLPLQPSELSALSAGLLESQPVCRVALGSTICSACGNGTCEDHENECNCPEDC